MVTSYSGGGGSPMTFFGLSDDDKPLNVEIVAGSTYGIPNASIFYEMDTGYIYMWDADGETWLKQ